MFKKNLAFTLAETLIVIAIIGVVAALTLPNLNSSTADKETVTRVKKIYAALTEATDRAQAVYGPIDGWFNGLSTDAEMAKRAKDRVTEFLKVSKDCGQGTGCWSTSPSYTLDGVKLSDNDYDEWKDDDYFVNLGDGTSIRIAAGESYGGYIIFQVDIDGSNKGKTTEGRDLFLFEIHGDATGSIPKGQLIPEGYSSSNWTGNTVGWYPAAWIVNNDNADYIKATCDENGVCTCPDGGELNWETKTSCN